MTKQDQKEFMVSLCNTAKEYFLKRVDKVPENWDGFELREWFADVARENYAYTEMSRSRKKEYNNDVIINNL